MDLEPLRLVSNRADKPHSQPPDFKLPLRPEQQRSLEWMIRQEACEEPFLEEEVEEAVLHKLGWRAEAKVQRVVVARGGIVADQVGYGKTAISLGLINCDIAKARTEIQPPKKGDPCDLVHGRIPTRATLVVAPAHLMKQWPSELVKFCGSSLKAVSIKTMADLNKKTIRDIMQADIVFVAVTVFRGALYLNRLCAFAGASRRLPAKAGRMFESVYEEINRCLGERIMEFSQNGEEGVKETAEAIEQAEKTLIHSETASDVVIGSSKMASYKKKGDAMETGTNGKKEEEEEEEEEKEKEQPKGKGKTTPAATKGKGKGKAPAKAKKTFAADDAWGLRTSSVRNDWTALKCPPMELFHFRRLVVDEFTYLGLSNMPDRVIVNTGLSAQFRWGLSGTPPLQSFDDISGMAQLLGIHLGVSDGKHMARGRGRHGGNYTRVELFKYFQEIHSPGWHARRHQLSQYFLDRYVRQNVAEIDEILAEEHVVRFPLPPAERAIYLEFDHHLKAMDMKLKRTLRTKKRVKKKTSAATKGAKGAKDAKGKATKGTKARPKKKRKVDDDEDEDDEDDEDEEDEDEEEEEEDEEEKTKKGGDKSKSGGVAGLDSDRSERIREIIEESSTAEEALLKRASHFSFSERGGSNPLEACNQIVEKRQSHLEQCKREIRVGLMEVRAQREALRKADRNYPSKVKNAREDRINFDWAGDFMRDPLSQDGDPEALQIMKGIIEEVNAGEVAVHLLKESKKRRKAQKKEDEEELEDDDEGERPAPKSAEDKLREDKVSLRENVQILHRLAKDLCEYVRALRFMKAIHDVAAVVAVGNKEAVPEKIMCTSCSRTVEHVKQGVLLCCGHKGCLDCLTRESARQKCIVADCGANVLAGSIVEMADIIKESKDLASSKFGHKIKRIVNLIKETIPSDERVIVFVQFKDLLGKVSQALRENGIQPLLLEGTAKSKAAAIQKMQKDGGKDASRVLFLNVTDESASGANLIACNHAIFVHPLLTESRQEYIACETQAIGRIRRYGQQKKVHIWRFLAEDTMDTQVNESRKYEWDEGMNQKSVSLPSTSAPQLKSS